ncbi:C4-dicarboxylate-binding periplasmic protein precursor [Vibrio aerogenes CECT 7868]|uniref:C4-dicarboxylate-binding periplasmic protein n=1 Tax=Vibrio aerogenes CECT 7868 TaxID=1216006 RepID=A0A1M6C6K0_9VIBR|nr:TRAP transporter substrate-binding protein [Vibrio aerogenes]SHI56625.1 C4-dicarboxylate-binding periplasmic protein precursor [Vibrio aerogenes CECT 7868]
MRLLVIFSLTLTLMFSVFKASASNMIVAHELPQEHPVSASLDWFAAEVKKRAGMDVKMYPGGELGNETALLKMVQQGDVAITKVGASLLTNYSDDYKVLALPYLFKDRAQYDKVLQGSIGTKILESTKSVGFVGLAFLDAGSRSFYTDKPIKTPADLKGLKIRVQNSSLPMDMMNALGAIPVPIAYSELYSALQIGLVNGAENNIPSFFSSKHYEVKKHYSYDRHTMVPDVLVVSTSAWNRFTDQERQVLTQVAAETVKVQEQNWKNYVDQAIGKLKQAGVTFTDSDIPAFQKAVQPVYDKFKKENPGLIGLLNEIQQQ